jgi:hypothetical protein
MMKPFSHHNLTNEERIFNYRLSRAWRIAENGFGILANRFRCLLSTMQLEPDTVKVIVMTCLCLHNVMRMRYPALQNLDLDRDGNDHQVIPGAWRNQAVLEDVRNVQGGKLVTREAKQQRVYLKHYYNNVGRLPWQDHMI